MLLSDQERSNWGAAIGFIAAEREEGASRYSVELPSPVWGGLQRNPLAERSGAGRALLGDPE